MNDPLRVWVDQEQCTGDGLCVQYAPEVFEFDVDGLAYVKDIDGELRQAPRAQVTIPAALRLDAGGRSITFHDRMLGEVTGVVGAVVVRAGDGGAADPRGGGASPHRHRRFYAAFFRFCLPARIWPGADPTLARSSTNRA